MDVVTDIAGTDRTVQRASRSTTLRFIGCVVAIGPALVTVGSGQVAVDGKPLSEPYLPRYVTTNNFDPIKVPTGYALLFGDNRPDSFDGRILGPTPLKNIGYRVSKVFQPVLG
jgi:signal peptidase I